MDRTPIGPGALLLALLLGGCQAMEYRDTNAAVDANPLCASRPDQPGQPISRDCERFQDGGITTRRDAQPIDFKPRRDE